MAHARSGERGTLVSFHQTRWVPDEGLAGKRNATIGSNFFMQSSLHDSRAAEIAKITELGEDVTSLRQHLQDVIDGAAFKGSLRSQQFLRYAVERAIAGDFECLKERAIGVELFGRSPSYNTGEDAIVRVTASDVRKRLLQHYGRFGDASEFRISLPPGSYIPEISRDTPTAKSLIKPLKVPLVVAQPEMVTTADKEGAPRRCDRLGWVLLGVLIAVTFGAIAGLVWKHFSRLNTATATLPWSVFFRPGHSTQLITSDPNIAEIEGLTHSPISLSDYANRRYVPEPNMLPPDVLQFCLHILRGDKAASVDTPIAASIAALAEASSNKISVRPARSIALPDLRTDDNFIFLGSPRTDPWTDLFTERSDFRIVFDADSGEEVVRDVHPRAGELASYIPTAKGLGTGQSFATITFLQNPDRNGQVLILAGLNAEGTEAAGKLATDLPRLSAVLRKCGIEPSGSLKHFQILVRVNTMAGSSSEAEVIACHVLPGTPAA